MANTYRFMKFVDQGVAPASMVVRDAVLFPIAKSLGEDHHKAVPAAVAVLEGWRCRIAELRAACRFNWTTGDAAGWHSNCHPSTVRISNGKPWICNRTDICPWCYGRRLEGLGDSLGFNLEVPPTTSKITLFRWSEQVSVDKGASGLLTRLECVSALTAQVRSEARPRSLGGFWQVHCQPDLSSTGWRIEAGIFLLRERQVGSVHYPGGWKAESIENPSPAQMRKLFVAATTYPVGLLAGDPRLASVCLEARSGLRLFGVFGCLRGKQKKELPPDAIPGESAVS